MATRTITVPIPSVHWFTYPLLVGGLLFVTWLWHDTRVNDAASKQAVASATTAQATVDKTVTATDKTAENTLKAKNAQLTKQLEAAKTVQAQVQLINKGANISLQENNVTAPAKPQAINPSSPSIDAPSFSIKPEDIQKLAALTIEKQQADNQVTTDQLVIAGKDSQIEARDARIAAQDTEIKTLKGGSHFKRFLKAAKYVAIGGAIGAGVVYANHH